MGSVAQIGFCVDYPFPQTDPAYGLCDWYAKSGVTVEYCDPDLELNDLSVEVSGHEALAEEFDAIHLRLCAASAVISGQLSPQGKARPRYWQALTASFRAIAPAVVGFQSCAF
jgi:hypothetical protein